jgi:quinol monooxygenase YgiN
MTNLFSLLALAGLAAASSSAQTPPPPAGPISFVTRLETNPAWVKEAIAALGAYREAARKEAGAIRVDVYQETSQPNRFLIDEVWKDFAAYEAHAKASKLADGLKAGLLAPPDGRPYTGWLVASSRKAPGANDLFVFTHLDVHPINQPPLVPILRPYVEKSRDDKGADRFEVLQGLLTLNEQQRGKIPDRKNHMTMAEAWASEADFYAHEKSAHALEFRTKAAPLLGALYDQRIYKLMK